MKNNMGSVDRIIRLLIGTILAGLYFSGIVSGTSGVVVLVIGVAMLITSFVGFCPLYAPFGLTTCKRH